MQVKKIFLASSSELKDDRRAFELMIGRLNQQWRQRDIGFELLVWENFIDAMSKDGLQKEYNKAIKECDVFVMLFFTKVGRFTLEEFETAFADMAAGTGPRIYTYFKNDFILTGDLDEGIETLLEFKARLRSLNHYVTQYRNAEDLQWQFSRQLEMLYGDGASSVEIGDSTPQAIIDETALVLCYRQLYGGTPLGQDNVDRLREAVQRAHRPIRIAVFNLASDVRRENWFTNKRLMERTIPIFEALIRGEPLWHAPYGELGYALKDKMTPNWQRAKESLEKALGLVPQGSDEGRYYHYNQAQCAINLDARYLTNKPADVTTRQSVFEMLKAAENALGPEYADIMQGPESTDIRAWLQLNGGSQRRRR